MIGSKESVFKNAVAAIIDMGIMTMTPSMEVDELGKIIAEFVGFAPELIAGNAFGVLESSCFLAACLSISGTSKYKSHLIMKIAPTSLSFFCHFSSTQLEEVENAVDRIKNCCLRSGIIVNKEHFKTWNFSLHQNMH